jgi:hypothetical protein
MHVLTLPETVKAGATFADDSRTQMTGSWFLLREESLDKARERLSQDVYATDGAWDMSKVGSASTSLSSSCRPRPSVKAELHAVEVVAPIYLPLSLTCARSVFAPDRQRLRL